VPPQAPSGDIVRTVTTVAVVILALGMGVGGWLRQVATMTGRTLAVAGELLLFYPTTLTGVVGTALFATAIAAHLRRMESGVGKRESDRA